MKIFKVLDSFYILILNTIVAASSGISPLMRKGLLNASLFCLNLIFITAYCNDRIKDLTHYKDYVLVTSTVLLIVVLIMSADRRIELTEYPKRRILFSIGWYLCFTAIFISSLKYYVRDAYFLWSILSLTLFPMLMIVWHRRGDYFYLCNVVAQNMVISSYLFYLANFVLVPFVTNDGIYGPDYLGLADNPNGNGMIVLPFFTAALYMLLSRRGSSFPYILSLLLSVVFATISNTRAAQAAMLLETVVAVCIYVRHRNILARHRLSLIFKALLAAVLLASMAGYVLHYADNIDLNAYAESEMEEAAEEVRQSEVLTNINNLASGRLILWKAYLKMVSFGGHGNPDGPLFEPYAESKWAHNNALDIWYASGFLAFAGYVLWLLAVWIFVLRCIFSKKFFKQEYLFTALAFTGYFIEAMLEITIYPMQTGIVFLAFVTIGPAAFEE